MSASVHGKKAAQNDPYAPSCKLCHGTHDILPPSNLKSPVRHHQRSAPLRRLSPRRRRSQQDPRHFADQHPRELQGQHSWHWPLPEGPDRYRGLHQLPYRAQRTSPQRIPDSSIAKQNIAKTCTKCHAQIETVHRQVIRGELWEKQPHLIPACVDCHEPHKVRKVYYTAGDVQRRLPELPRESRP